MAKIGKISIEKTEHNEDYSKGHIYLQKNLVGKIKIYKNIGAMELQVAAPYVSILDFEAKDFYANYSTLCSKDMSNEEILVLYLKTLLMLDELEDCFVEIVQVTGCKNILMISYSYGITYIPSNSKELLRAIANIIKADEHVEETILLNEDMFDFNSDRREADDYCLIHHLFS